MDDHLGGMTPTFNHAIEEIGEEAWTGCISPGDTQPLSDYKFLSQLEISGCVGQAHGWLPYHLSLRDASSAIRGVMPLYFKLNGYGEFVFDYAWQQAYAANDIPYYPKLVSAIPYTPVTGTRCFAKHKDIVVSMVQAAIAETQRCQLSGVHWLFLNDSQKGAMQKAGMALRMDCQFHWNNQGYTSFDDFLSQLTSKRRKTIKRERKWVCEQNIQMRILRGSEVSLQTWKILHALYVSIYDRKCGYPPLSLDFFLAISRMSEDRMIIIAALQNEHIEACALCFRSHSTLYGRYWGCRKFYNCLHFETCYYTGIEYCINERLKYFEPGAQGEHKISRDFYLRLPGQHTTSSYLK